MRAAILLIVLLALVLPPAHATPSSAQNDAGTGGDAGNWADHAAPLNDRQCSPTLCATGVYDAELYRYADENDWYSIVVPAGTDSVNLSYTVRAAEVPCSALAPDTTIVATLVDPAGLLAAQQALDPCYSTGNLLVHQPLPGKWLIAFQIQHPAGLANDNPLVGHETVWAPESTVVHERYVFGVDCQPFC